MDYRWFVETPLCGVSGDAKTETPPAKGGQARGRLYR